MDFMELINLEILVQLSANSSGLIDLAGNTWTYHKKEITRIRDEENYEEESEDIDLGIAGKFPDTLAININENNWISSDKEIILPYNEKWFIYLWNYKIKFSNYDIVLGGTNAKYYSLQNNDGEYAQTIGMRIDGQGYSIKSLIPQELDRWVHYYIDCDGNGNIFLYIDGKIQQRIYRKQNIIFKPLNLGAWSFGTCKEGTPGFIDDLVIAKGEQLFFDEFDIPDEPFSLSFFNRNIKKIKRYSKLGQNPKNQHLFNMFVHL